jgi:hypothetical protein
LEIIHSVDLGAGIAGPSDVGVDSPRANVCNGFSAMAYYDAGVEPVAVALVDDDRDGLLDIAVASNVGDATTVGPSQVLVLRNLGDGTFATEVMASLGGKPNAIAFADFNNLGTLDLAVGLLDELPPGIPQGAVGILLPQGGNLLTQAAYPVGSDTVAIATGDFDGDGFVDVVSADGTDGAVALLLNEGDGTFRAPSSYPLSGAASSMVVADFNGDGRPDVAVALIYDPFVNVLLGASGGAFDPPALYGVGMGPSAITIGDFDGDGHPDLAVANGSDGTVSVLLGARDGTFGPQAVLTVRGQPAAITAADFDGDGATDLAIADVMKARVDVLAGRGKGTFALAARYDDVSVPSSIAAGVLVAGRRPRVAVTNPDTGQIGVLLPCP